MFDMQKSSSQPGTLYNAITVGSKVVGTISADSDIRIDGTLEGDLICTGKLVVGEKGYIKGNVTCQSAEILGKVEGKLEVKQNLALRASATLSGELKTQSLIVEPHAVFNGTCSMTPEPQPVKK